MAAQVNEFNKLINIKGEINMNKKLVVATMVMGVIGGNVFAADNCSTCPTVEKHTKDIKCLNIRVDRNVSYIKTLQSQMVTVNKDVVSANERITTNAQGVQENATGVKNNAQAIKLTADAIGVNAKKIKANTNAIKVNAEEIRVNANNIRTNTTQIKANRDAIKVNAGNIKANTDAINRHETVINNHTTIINNHAQVLQSHEETLVNHGNAIADHENRITSLESGLTNNVNQEIGKAGAANAALSALHYLGYNKDDKMTFSVGYGHYKGHNAVALGGFYAPNEHVMFSVGTTLGSERMVNASVNFRLGKGSEYELNHKGKIKELETLVTQLVAEVEELKASK